MPDNEENKTVDIDTSGPEVDVELENESTENETPEIETAQAEETKTEVVEQPEEKIETKETPKEDELEKYSESVQKRIAKLTKKWREAERQKEEALHYAKSVLTEKEKAEQKLSKIEQPLESSIYT